MEKLKNFFSNYKSDILNVLGVVALIAVVVVGAVLFFGKDDAQPNVVEDSTVAATTEVTTTEPTTVEPETTVSAATETTTKVLTTTTKPAQKPTEAPTKAPSNNTPNNTPVNTEEGTLPAGLADDVPGSSYDYEQRLVCYNDDANIVAAYNDALSRGVKPTRIYYKNGKYDDVIYTGWDMPYDEIVLCKRCGKPQGGGTHGTCASSFNGHNCSMCGEWIPAGGCHTCKY